MVILRITGIIRNIMGDKRNGADKPNFATKYPTAIPPIKLPKVEKLDPIPNTPAFLFSIVLRLMRVLIDGRIKPTTKPHRAKIIAIATKELKTGISKKRIAVIVDIETINRLTSNLFVILPKNAEEIAAVAPKTVNRVPVIALAFLGEWVIESMNNAKVGLSTVTPNE